MLHRPASLVVIATAALFVVVLPLFYYRLSWDTIRTETEAIFLRPDEIPDSVHFVFLLKEPGADFPFVFFHYLSVYAAWYHLKPSSIYLHTDASAEQIARAREGAAGKWARLILTMPGLKVEKVEAPTVTRTGKEIKEMAHKSDFVRVEVVDRFGGLYIDFDVFAVRDARPLLSMGFQAVCGREPGGLLTAGVFLAKQRSELTSLWTERMHDVFDGRWTTHSNELMTEIGDQLLSSGRRLLVLEEQAFTPVTWQERGIRELLDEHEDVPSLLGGKLPELRHWEEPVPSWAVGFNRSYFIHGFHIEEMDTVLTPARVLTRRSNLGRAMYPVVRDMYDRSLVSVDDEG
ncbi:glycosyl transferase [Ophiocordyceps camponoti-floridani]|uniref:Glycosyl transferase n=1 Tax=Ophiocordyceps camponoti-floridani TaxID=2030778 RepID=A0A8H4VFK4_9HYPO|nr:glycosyl transferase [Ophiocordyceps camponoti-floridani]